MERNINDQVTVGTDAVVVSLEKSNMNGKRISLVFTNTSAGGQVITIAIDKEAVANQGIVLNPGGSWSTSASEGYLPTQSHITAVSDLAGGLLSIQERVI